MAAIIVLAGLFCGLFEEIHPFGIPASTAMDDYFIVHAPEDRSSHNVVTSMVFDYRGFDTIGEASVLFTALSSIAALFRNKDARGEGDGGRRG
jgi:multisubunit Na+/H+ antiporter MnhB subunit